MKNKATRTLIVSFVFVFLLLSLQSHRFVSAESVAPGGLQNSSITQSSLKSLNNSTNLIEVEAATDAFLAQYDMDLTTACPVFSDYDCDSLDSADFNGAKKYALFLIEEWSKYPAVWIDHTDLQTIIFAKNYIYKEDGSHVGGTPRPEVNAIVYDVTFVYDEEYARNTIHHEYSHYFDFARTGDYYAPDPVWAAYNPNWFEYLGSGYDCQGEDVSESCMGEYTTQGFVTGYSAYSIAEDKAEIYAYLFRTSGFVKLSDWISEDPALAKKKAYYEKLIEGIVPSMNGAYFNNIHGFYSSTHPGTGFVLGPVTKTLNDIGTQKTLHIFGKRIFIVNGERGGTTVDNDGVLKGSGKVGDLGVLSGGRVAPGESPGCLSAGATTFESGSFLDIEIAGNSVCTEYDQLKVVGALNIDSPTLNISMLNGFKPAKDATFIIVDNDGDDAITGTFKDLPEGAAFTVDGIVYKITYKGGDGNDVALTVQNVPGSPNTGMQLAMANPLVTFALTTVSATALFIMARRYRS